MMYKHDLKDLLGDVANILVEYIKRGVVGKEELKRLASELELIPVYNGYKDKDPFNANVARSLLSDLLDEEGDSQSHWLY